MGEGKDGRVREHIMVWRAHPCPCDALVLSPLSRTILLPSLPSSLQASICPILDLPLPFHPGLCLAHMRHMEEADLCLAALLAEPPDQFGDLYLEVGNAFIVMGQHGRAAGFLERIEVGEGLRAGCWWWVRFGSAGLDWMGGGWGGVGWGGVGWGGFGRCWEGGEGRRQYFQ